MIFGLKSSRSERSVVTRLQLLGLDGERTIRPRHEFRAELRERLVAEAADRDCCGDDHSLALAGC